MNIYISNVVIICVVSANEEKRSHKGSKQNSFLYRGSYRASDSIVHELN